VSISSNSVRWKRTRSTSPPNWPEPVLPSTRSGRLVPEDVIGLIRYLREHAAPATPA
jgi:hypothetical protein